MKKKKCLIYGCIAVLLVIIGFCIAVLTPYGQISKARINNSSVLTSSYTNISGTTSNQSESYDALVVPQNDEASKSEETVTENTELSSVHESAQRTDSTSKNNSVQTVVSQVQSQSQSQISTPPPITINSGKTVYADLKVVQLPQEADFGEHYDYALDLYNRFKSGNFESGKQYEFSGLSRKECEEEIKNFFDTFKATCLKGVDELIIQNKSVRTTYYQSSITRGGRTEIMVTLSEKYFNEYQRIVWVQNTIQSIVGDGISEKTVIDRMTDWCINHCSYDHNHQYIGEPYRSDYTIAQELLQSKSGICHEFAKLICCACDLYGIPNEYIGTPNDGRPQSLRHAWNRICIGGTWYYADVTWDVCYGYNAYPLSETLWEDHNKFM